MIIKRIFNILFDLYGYQGWWPVPGSAGSKGFDSAGYHPGNYEPPQNKSERFEIITGAVLTQNTSWNNVEIVLRRIKDENLITPQSIIQAPLDMLASIIRPSGYYNQKAKKLKIVSEFFLNEDRLDKEAAYDGRITRDKLLSLWGIGRETADSILLYAYHFPVFVIDSYTVRIISRAGLIKGGEGYDEIQRIFIPENSNPADRYYNEYHALLVLHAKRFCRKEPLCRRCPLKVICRMGNAAAD
ncbi:MAG: DNA repair protein [Spirochaetes bacterium]|nr:DNA repair protein [Spirochaetota bacterium]